MKSRKLNTLAAALLLGMGISGMAQAVTLQVGNFGMKLSGAFYYDDPDLAPGQAAPIGGTGSGRTWGIAEINSIHPLLAGSHPDVPVLGSSYWSSTPGDRLFVRLGGSIASRNCGPGVVGGCAPVGGAFPGFPHDTFFVADAAAYTKGGAAYVEVYHHTVDSAYTTDYLAGYDGPVAGGDGTYDDFGKAIAWGADLAPGGGDDPTLWLDLVMTAGILPNYDANALPGDVEKTVITGLTTGASTIYADIVGGSAMSQFGQNIFPVLNPAYPVRSDIRMQSTLIAFYDPGTNTWTNPTGWTTGATDPVTGGVVPEPATLALLGLGLVGLAGLRRKAA